MVGEARTSTSGPLSREKIEELNSYFEQVTSEGKKFTNDQIASAIGISIPTIIKYKRIWERKQAEQEALKNLAVQPEPIELFEAQVRNIPGIAESKVDYVLGVIRGNEKLLENPNEVHKLLTQGLKLTDFYVEMVLKSLFPNQSAANFGAYGHQTPPGYGQPIGNPYSPPYGQPSPYGPPGAPQWPYPYPPPPPGYPPYWGQPPAASPQPGGITREDLRTIFAEFRDRNEPTPQNFEEVEEPVIVNGQVILDGEGQVVRRVVRRPYAGPTPPSPPPPPVQRDPVEYLVRLREAGIIPDANKALPPPIAPVADPALVATLSALRESQSGLMARYEAETVRRQEAEKYAIALSQKDDQIREAEINAIKAGAGMPPDAVILSKALDKTDKVMENVDKRLSRIENLAIHVLLPPGAGPASSTVIDRSEAELQALLDKTARVDATENPPPIIVPPALPRDKRFVPPASERTAAVAAEKLPEPPLLNDASTSIEPPKDKKVKETLPEST